MNQLSIFKEQSIDQPDNGWEIDSDCPLIMKATRGHYIEEYERQLQKLQTVEGAIQFWQGDVANQLQKEYSTKAMKEIAENVGLDVRTITNYAYVCRNTEVSLRSDTYQKYSDLSFGHYQVVAPIKDDDEKRYWLNIAGEEELTIAQLRKRIKGEAWEPRYFNHWSAFPLDEWQQEYPGQIPGQILMNILYYTTEPGDLVIDPFGGGGNMALACEQMDRYCITYDIAPKYPGIKKHDATQSFPEEAQGAQLVFLDPPYWKQKKGEYESDPQDLSNKTLDEFYSDIETVFINANDILSDGGYCVLIIGATQENGKFHDHAGEIFSRVRDKWEIVNRVAAAYPTTQYTGNDMNNAKANKQMLNLYTMVQFFRKVE